MARAIQDLFINQGYNYYFSIDLEDSVGLDIEVDYTCYFECDSIGKLEFSVVDDRYELIISGSNTDKLETQLEEYVVYVTATIDGEYDKLLGGRIHIDEKVRT